MANILVVDDAMVMRKKLKMVLSAAGHNIIAEAGNGLEAVKAYQEFNPDLVTMDITMPSMDGLECVRKILEIDAKAKIIMVSAVNQQNKVFEAIESGAKHYVVKPINDQKLVETVNQVLKDSTSVVTKSSVDDNTHPFSVINNNGEFVISILKLLSENDLVQLEKAVDGMLYINPLVVSLDLTAPGAEYNANFEKLIPLINRIKQNNGKLSIIK